MMNESQFQGIFVGFCSRVDKERPIIRIPRQLTLLISQSFLQLIYDRIRIKHQLLQLLTHALHQIRMRMFHRNHGMSAIQIKIGLPLLVIYLTTFFPLRYSREKPNTHQTVPSSFTFYDIACGKVIPSCRISFHLHSCHIAYACRWEGLIK